jgi:hypothetical protein
MQAVTHLIPESLVHHPPVVVVHAHVLKTVQTNDNIKMLTPTQKVYLIVLLISFLCSLVSFRLHYPFYLKIFSIFLGITVITEIIANFLLPLFNISSNYPVYNIFILIQFLFLLFYFRLLIKSHFFKKVIFLLVFLYPVFWIITSLALYNLDHWNSYALMVGDLIIIIFTSRWLFEFFTGNELISLSKHSEFWIAIGILLYSSCELPITGMVNFLVKDIDLARRLFTILQILNIIMYLIFIYAYLCQIKPTVKKSLS